MIYTDDTQQPPRTESEGADQTSVSVIGALAEIAVAASRHRLPEPISVQIDTVTRIALVNVHTGADHAAWCDAFDINYAHRANVDGCLTGNQRDWRGLLLAIRCESSRSPATAQLDKATLEEIAVWADAAGWTETALTAAALAGRVHQAPAASSLAELDAPERCAAAHAEDRSPCEGVFDAVRVSDRAGEETLACVHHGAVLLASLAGGEVHPGPRMCTGDGSVAPGAAIDVYQRAQQLRPFAFQDGGDGGSVAGELR